MSGVLDNITLTDSSGRRNICIITGTRADWGLLRPLARELAGRENVTVQIVATNMHLMRKYGMTVNEIAAHGFEVNARVPLPEAADTPAGRALVMAECARGVTEALEKLLPDTVVILGDRFEMLGAAAAVAIMQIPLVHIAGGEITEGAVDDSIRHAITKLASLHFTETEEYRRRVISMGENPERVVNTGSPGVWNLHNVKLLTRDELERFLNLSLDRPTMLVTFHPVTRGAVSSAQECGNMLEAMDRFPEMQYVITFPNNDAGSSEIIELIKTYAQENEDRVRLIPSLGMQRYLSLLPHVRAVVGNSSSGLIEVPSAGVPTVNIGVRQKGRVAGPSVITCAETADNIAQAMRTAVSDEFSALAARKINPYFQPDTPAVMADNILKFTPAELADKKFYEPDEIH
ncbi:MAG: UDP-N-acetylglucosamine 2-epimerase (hydrolyzing) [Muribaculaceae bacterium]|nr:UDP-N-acetylglucosamine 2-epimerase (hydrolyzing) [Muribaculaceae bacterium]